MKRRHYQKAGLAIAAMVFLALFASSSAWAVTAAFTATDTGSQTVSFDAAGSEGTSYEWNFGDGSGSTGITTTHTYEYARTYAVTLTVRDAAGNKAIKIINVAVGAAYEPGDVDGSGKVNIFDALMAAEFDAGLKEKDELPGYGAGDTDGTGGVTVFDALIIAKYDAGLISNNNWNNDGDGDGYTSNQGDLDDDDPAIYPGAREICGDGIDQDCNGEDLVCTEEGVFVYGGGVEGLQYQTETLSGVTDENGTFEYMEGETITFSIGDIVVGQCEAKSVITPADLDDGARKKGNKALNICSFLMTLDDDDDAENGILINETVKLHAFSLSINFNVTVAEFETETQSAVYLLTAFRSKGRRLLVFAMKAEALLDATLENEEEYAADEDEDGYTIAQNDCDDTNPDVNPGETEQCGDGIDQDCDGADLVCPNADSITLDNGFKISFLEVVYNDDGTSSWRYLVEELETAQDLSNWVLELPDCVTINSAEPESFEAVDPDPNSELSGIKWETSTDFESGEFTVILDGHLDAGTVNVAAKGPDVVLGQITGPACDEIVEDQDGDGYTLADGDCNDMNADISPAVMEICGDGIDQDCDDTDMICVEDPEEGQWSGTSNQEHPIKFMVVDGNVSAIFAKMDYDDQAGTCVGTNTLSTGSSTIIIEDNKFTFSTSDVDVSGEFTSATTCEGTWFYKNEDCEGTGNGIWEAALEEDEDDNDVDDDGDGYSENDGDCNDDDAAIHPDAAETCGDGIDQDCDEEDYLCSDDTSEVLEGIFLFGGALEGVGYKTDSVCGVTDADGTFTYLEGETVTFFIGNIILGQIIGQEVVTPSDLVEDADNQTNIAVINICRLLLTLDNDNNSANGISIIYDLRMIALNMMVDIDFDVDTDIFEEDIQDVIYTLTLCKSSGVTLLVIALKAENILNITLEELLADYTDDDGDGYSENDGDCDDTDAGIHPDAEEICDDDIDQNCDGNDACSDPDVDDDGDGFTENDGDCDDTDAAVCPNAEETCGDGIDQDCNGTDLVCVIDAITEGEWAGTTDQEYPITFTVAEGEVSDITVKMDYKNEYDNSCVGTSELLTGNLKAGIVDNSFTFSTADVDVSGTFTSATTCLGTWYYKNMTCGGVGIGTWEASISEDTEDADGDGYTEDQGDCDNENADAYPGAAEVCGDGVDQDCDGDDLICLDDSDTSEDAGIFSLSLTCKNADTDKYQAVYVTIKEAQIKGKGSWQTIGTVNKTYALFDLIGGTTEALVLEKLQAGLEGDYKHIRLILSDTPEDDSHPYANYVVDTDGEAHKLKVPSGVQSGIKIKYKFTIVKAQTTELVLAFDASKSIKVDKKWKKCELKPKLKVTSCSCECDCCCDDDDDSSDHDSKDDDSSDDDSKDDDSKDDDD